VELVKQIAPDIGRINLIYNPPTAPFIDAYLGSFKAAAAALSLEASVTPVLDMREIEAQVSASATNSGLVVIPDAFTVAHRAEIAALADRHRVPAVFWSRSFAELGGLIAYGPVLVDEYRRAAVYADRILKGEKPSELPVQTPVKFELVINMKTAKAFGLTVPEKLRALADDVIE
jgi:putative ABC transport system substrate-binding protein